MDMNKIIALVVALVVGATLVFGLLAPVVSNSVDPDQVQYTNSGSISAQKLADGDYGSIAIDNTTVTVSINGVQQTWTSTSAVNPLYGQNALVNHNIGAASISLIYVIDGAATTVSSLTSIDYVVEGQNLKITANGTEYVVDLADTFIWGDSGDYTAAFRQNASTIYYSSNSPYYRFSPGAYAVINGEISPSDYTLTTNAQLVEGTQDVYKVTYSDANFVISNSGESVSAGVWMLISKEVVGLGPDKVSNTYQTMAHLIPLLVIITLVTFTAAFIQMRRTR